MIWLSPPVRAGNGSTPLEILAAAVASETTRSARVDGISRSRALWEFNELWYGADMSNAQLSVIRQIDVPIRVIDDTLKTMRQFGAKGWEALVLWLGQVDSGTGTASVSVAFVPKQRPIANEDGVGYFVASETLFQLNKALSETGLRLIAQVHSHPSEAYHSEADDRYAIVTAEGGFSLVVPDFGNAPPSPTAWAVYRLRGSQWLALNRRQTESVFVVGPKA